MPLPDPTETAVVAVIVTYHPGPDVARTLEAALAQAGHVVVVDNGSAPEELAAVEAAAASTGRLDLLRNPDNRGIAAAQNQGIARARALGAGWVLLLDQDSVAEPGMVSALLAAVQRDSVGLAAAVPCDPTQQRKPVKFLTSPDGRRTTVAEPSGPVLTNLLYAIASGSLIPLPVLDRVGGMREDFFIDFVDVEFGLRLRRAGYDVVAVRDARLRHRLGAYEERWLFGRLVPVTHHSAERRYTQYRNRVRTLRLHGLAMPALLRSEMPAIALDLLRLALFETGRWRKLRATLRGAAAGLFG